MKSKIYKGIISPIGVLPAQVCNGFHPEKLNDCERDLVKTYLDSHSQLREIVAAKFKAGHPTSQRKAKQSI